MTVTCPSCEATVRPPGGRLTAASKCPWCGAALRPEPAEPAAAPPVARAVPPRPPTAPARGDTAPVPVAREADEPPRPASGGGRTALVVLLVSLGLAAGAFVVARQLTAAVRQLFDSGSAAAPEPATASGDAAPPTQPEPPRPPAAPAPKPTEIRLPGPLKTATVGGGGRYLVLHAADAGQVIVYDLTAGRVTATLNGIDDAAQVAAGRDKLIVGRGSDGRLTRFDLATGTEEATATPAPADPLRRLALGSASDGPLVVVTRTDAGGRVGLVDPTTLRELRTPIDDDRKQFPPTFPVAFTGPNTPRPVASGDGRAVAFLNLFLSHDGGDRYRVGRPPGPGAVLPAADGRSFFGAGVFDDRGRPVAPPPTGGPGRTVRYLPSVAGPYFVAVATARNADRSVAGVTLNLHIEANPTPVGPLPGGGELTEWAKRGPAGWAAELDHHLFVIPDPGFVVVAVPGARAAVVYKVDMRRMVTLSGLARR